MMKKIVLNTKDNTINCKHFTPCNDKPEFQRACLVEFGQCSCSKADIRHFEEECPEYFEACNGWIGKEDEALGLGDSYRMIYQYTCVTCNGSFEFDEVQSYQHYGETEYRCHKCCKRFPAVDKV